MPGIPPGTDEFKFNDAGVIAHEVASITEEELTFDFRPFTPARPAPENPAGTGNAGSSGQDHAIAGAMPQPDVDLLA